jgi:hypothetical protein
MKIPFLDLKMVNAELEQDINRAVKTVIDSGWYILGRSGEAFEQNSKAMLVGDREGYVLGCNSGTDALVLSLLAAGVGTGDEVITVSHTAIPTVCAIKAVGASVRRHRCPDMGHGCQQSAFCCYAENQGSTAGAFIRQHGRHERPEQYRKTCR